MSDRYEPIDQVIAGVINAARDLHWSYSHDPLAREYLRENLKHIKLARLQIEEVIRKAEIAPVIEGAFREARQAETHKVPA